jgi:hypothetical protein
VESLEPVYCKSVGNFEAQNYKYFCKKSNRTATATPGVQDILIISKKTIVIQDNSSFEVASCQVGSHKIPQAVALTGTQVTPRGTHTHRAPIDLDLDLDLDLD